MKKNIIYLFLAILLPISGCKKFLEEEPRVQASIKTADQLEALINNATAFTYQNNFSVNYSTDDTEIPLEVYRNGASVIPLAAVYHYVFGIEDVANLASDPLWNAEYSKIFTANIVLDYADKVTGDPAVIAKVRADAYLIRAYAYWELANYYCAPYSISNLESPGLPIKTTTSYEESLVKKSLKQTYEQIFSDLTEAQKLATYDINPLQRWRASKPAIDAFLSRYYLFTGDYDLCLKYANDALSNTVAKLVDFNTLTAGTSQNFTNPTVSLSYSILNNWAASKFYYWDELYFARFVYNANQWNIPSTALTSQYESSNDLRFINFFIPNSNRRFGILSPATLRYTIFYDGRYLPEGPTVGEVLLNKAEALARKGDFGNAMNTINLLRLKRMKTKNDLSASTTEEGLKKVLEERRRELPFTFRWLDIRRFAANADVSDDVEVSHQFFKLNNGIVDLNTTQNYKLPVNSTRYKVPINQQEINASRGQIIQNTY